MIQSVTDHRSPVIEKIREWGQPDLRLPITIKSIINYVNWISQVRRYVYDRSITRLVG